MAAVEPKTTPLNLEQEGDDDLIKLKPIGCNPLRFIPFVVYLFYVQFVSAVVFVLLLFGIYFSPATVSGHLCDVLCCKYATTPKSSKVLDDTKEPVIFLSNHRSFCDFFADGAMLGGTAFVSRWLVLAAVPFTGLWGHTQGWLWFFGRGVKREGGTLKWMEDFYMRSHANWLGKGMLVYPEGTRGQKPWGASLKQGGLVVAHSMGWPVQCVVTTNKENVMLEGKAHVALGVTLVSSVAPALYPADYSTTDEFIAAVEKVWRDTWRDAYSHEGIPRDTWLLPGAVNKAGATACPGTRSLNVGRVVALVLVAFFTRGYWLSLLGQ